MENLASSSVQSNRGRREKLSVRKIVNTVSRKQTKYLADKIVIVDSQKFFFRQISSKFKKHFYVKKNKSGKSLQ